MIVFQSKTHINTVVNLHTSFTLNSACVFDRLSGGTGGFVKGAEGRPWQEENDSVSAAYKDIFIYTFGLVCTKNINESQFRHISSHLKVMLLYKLPSPLKQLC